jgi:hypothetical protein
MYENSNLKDGVRVQVRQIQIVKIEKTTEGRRYKKSESTDEKGLVNNRFMGILCWNSDPTTDPPRT